MTGISRRDLLCSGVALSASSLLTRSAWARTAALFGATRTRQPPEALAAVAPREQLLFDFGWKFQFGHGTDPARDLGFGNGPGRLCQDRRLRLCQGEVRRLEVAHAESAARLGGGVAVCARRGAELARLQAAGPALSGDQRGLVPARVRDSGQRPGPAHCGRVRRRLPRRAGLCERLLYRPQRQRLCALPLRPDGLSELRRQELHCGCAWTRALATAGSTRARASTAMCG